jgi:dienelactone hydrolase
MLAAMPPDRGILRRWGPAAVALAALAACSDDAPAADPDGGADARGLDAAGPDAGAYRAETLATTTYADGDRTWSVTLARIHRPDGGRTYVQWIPSDKPGPRPVVVATMPYAGIAWTGEAVDTRWAALPAGQHPDVDGPGYDGRSQIVYEPTTVDGASDTAKLHLLNDLSALLVYGRFYAGGSVGDDVADMRAGMWFVAEQAGVDRARIGTFGGSWGGFEALYAAAGADPRAPAAVAVAIYPPSDFATWVEHARSRTQPVRDFLEPYLRRIYATTGGPPDAPDADYGGLRLADLCPTLPTDTLVLHDDLDNLVPIAQSQALGARCGADAVYWPRAGAPDPGAGTHGPLGEEPGYASYLTYAVAYLHLRLAPPSQVVVGLAAKDAMIAHLTLVRAAAATGRDVSWAAPRLRELCDPRLYLYDLSAMPIGVRTGAAVVADAVNAVWGTSYTEATIAAALAGGLPRS